MTKEELVESLADGDLDEELAEAEIPEEQVALVVEMYGTHAEKMARYTKCLKERRELWWKELEPYYELYHRLFIYMDTSFYDGIDVATIKARSIQTQQARTFCERKGFLGSPEQQQALYDALTPRAMKYGRFISEWVRGLELDGIYPEGLWTKTIYFFAACEVLVATEGEFNDLTGEEHSAAFFFADAVIGANKVYSDDAGYYQYWEEADPNTLDFMKQNKQMTKVLDELDDKFQALTDERDALQRRLNRNREIAVAIWKLQTMADKDFKFRYKYQWIGIYEVMRDHHLLSDEEKSTFCRICNSPDSPDYFLPDNEHDLPNPYVPGESWEKDSTWHQLSSHGDTPRQRREIDKTKKEFSLLLKEHGIIE